MRLVAVPTTAGTGSEVSPAAVLTAGRRKVTLVDYSLVPDVAVVDPTLTLSMPPELTADVGVDALTHALEAYVSIFASPYTDAFCLQAINLILGALPRAYADGGDIAARTDMANAATLAGLAFSNAFLGVNHALAHAVGARFGVAHGRANGIFLPHVLRYNAAIPAKFMPAPGYSAYVAPAKYAQIAWVLGLGGRGEDDGPRAPVRARRRGPGAPSASRARCASTACRSPSLVGRACPSLCRAAFADPSGRTNPRMPLLSELHDAAPGRLRADRWTRVRAGDRAGAGLRGHERAPRRVQRDRGARRHSRREAAAGGAASRRSSTCSGRCCSARPSPTRSAGSSPSTEHGHRR